MAKSTVNNGVSDNSVPVELETPVQHETPVDEPAPEKEELDTEATRSALTEHYLAMTVNDLKDELWGLELSTSGVKADLVERLVEWRMSRPVHEANAQTAEGKGDATQ